MTRGMFELRVRPHGNCDDEQTSSSLLVSTSSPQRLYAPKGSKTINNASSINTFWSMLPTRNFSALASSTSLSLCACFSGSNKNQKWREARIKWNLFSNPMKLCVTFALLLVILTILGNVMNILYQFATPPLAIHLPANATYNSDGENSFAVVINTYKRPEMLRDAVQHYGESCGRRVGVSQVFVVWAELQVAPPNPDAFFQQQRQQQQEDDGASVAQFLRILRNNRSQISILRVPRDSLNSRFLPIADLKSQAVFMVDDDVRVDCQSLAKGFEAWKANPLAMVGYYPRLAALSRTATTIPGKSAKYIYQAWPIVWWRHSMNFVLTKASFLHARYLSMYSDPSIHPVQVLEYVDKHMNCEDVAMALLVANATIPTSTTRPNSWESRGSGTVAPSMMIYVEGSVSDKGIFNGISTHKGGMEHMNARSTCLDDLTKIYQDHGWPRPLDRVFALRQSSWVQHATGWQYRPSNVFEWFALENIFK
ncbi:hypothetical protein ACA910_003161 [Epithemia clementina (nom. ined.)]